MAFKKVSDVDFPKQELEIMKFWQENNIFEKTVKLHKGQPRWSFIDGPITANNPMGVHHGWGRTYKDLYNRFQTMHGHELRYQNGFDCQGLWVEVEVEKELNFTSKKDIEEYGLAKFVNRCKERVLRYAAVQTEQSLRLGYAMDWDDPTTLRRLADAMAENPAQEITVRGTDGLITDTVENIVGKLGSAELGGSYYTFADENNYMIWTFIKKCWENGWVYKGADVMPWCPRCATGISQHEIVTDGYAELIHQGVTLQFPLRGRENESLLIWTTTPWTLTSNVAVAVGPDLDYVKVKQGDEFFYLSKGTTHILKGDYQVRAKLKGKDMVGWTYNGPFDELSANQKIGGHTDLPHLVADVTMTTKDAHVVIEWNEVGESEGTGLVHIATGCGAEDFKLGMEQKLPIVAPLDEAGYFVEGFGWLTGMFVGDVAQPIFDNLKEKDILYNVEDYTHRYPICWRCATELVFRLVDEWFINMGELYDKPREELTHEEKKASVRYQIMDIVEQIRWIPSFGLERELDWLRNMHDWMISKKRFWGLALPIWECSSCKHFEIIGDEVELKERAAEGWKEFEGHPPHRPHVDAVKITCPKCETLMSRIKDVGNPWLDAGIIPFSTMQYRTNPDYWNQWYPSDLISESFPGQFRNWFYSLLVMATVLDNSPPFKANFTYGTLVAEDGRAMHKSWGNSIEFNKAADKMGVDVMRWMYCNHKSENNLFFGYNRADEVRRQFLLPLWNAYKFLVNYAILDDWTPNGETLPILDNVLDTWIISRLNQVIDKVNTLIQNYDPFNATLVVESFINDLTNWYIRRSRRRFWRSEQDNDKKHAYAVLYHVITTLTRLLAPITPFVTEVMYQNLVHSNNPPQHIPFEGEGQGVMSHESVHHCEYPKADLSLVNDDILDQMSVARQVCSLGLSARNQAGLKVRQPLSKILVHMGDYHTELKPEFVQIILDELNVKQFEIVSKVESLVAYQVLPNNKILGPKFGRQFPKIRQALVVADHAEIVKKVNNGESISLDIDGESVVIYPDEVVIQTKPIEGLAVGADKHMTVGIDTIITDELATEGMSRELVRHIQALRKEAGFNIEDRITVYYQTDGDIANVFDTWTDYIKEETLTNELVSGTHAEEIFTKSVKIGKHEVMFGLKKI